MTQETAMDKEMLAAFADDELTPEQAARVVMHLADHPQDQAFVDDLMAANAALARAYAGPAGEPVPERFLELLTPAEKAAGPESATTQSGAGRPASRVIALRPRLSRRAATATAAALALAAGFAGALVFLQPAQDPAILAAGPVAPGSALHRALDSRPSGQSERLETGRLTILASMPAQTGFCREVEWLEPERRHVALACRDAQGWVVDVAMSQTLMPGTGGDGFTPAGGAGEALLDHWLERRQAGPTLSAEAEAAAIAAGWQG